MNEPYRRLKALSEMARDTREVVGGGLSTYIIQGKCPHCMHTCRSYNWLLEYGKARGEMGDTSFEWPWNLYSTSTTPFHDIGQEILKDFPLVLLPVTTESNIPRKLITVRSITRWSVCGIIRRCQ